jgi:signal transduction histidine kinase
VKKVPVSSSGLPRAFLASALPAVALGVGTLALVLPSGLDARQATIVLFVCVIAAGYLGAGLWIVARQRATRLGLLTVAIGCALFFTCWLFSSTPIVYTLGLMFGLLWLPIIGHLVLAFPSGHLRRPVERALAGFSYAVAIVLQPLPWLFWEGDWKPVCDDCPRNLALVEPNRDLAHALIWLYLTVGAAGGAATLIYLIRVRWWHAPARERYAVTPVVAVGTAMFVFLAAAGIAVAVGLSALAQGLDFGYFTALAALPFALLASLQRRRAARSEAIGQLAERLGSVVGPDELRDALAEAFGDPTLEIAYWVGERDAFVDGRGREIDLGSRARTEIRHGERLLAAIAHDPSIHEDGGLGPVARAALALALERERLAVALRANVRELRESRARIVQAGDDARRRIERDLHDGAQQRLVSLLLNVQLARRAAAADDAAPIWDGLEHELADALSELRALASGILPPALSDQGLEAAVEDLAGRSAVDVTIAEVPRGRLPERVEIAAYFVIAEALANVAKHSNATGATVSVTATEGRLCVEVSDDGIGGAAPERGSGLRGLTDRVEALDGHLSVASSPATGTTLRAEIPCAW